MSRHWNEESRDSERRTRRRRHRRKRQRDPELHRDSEQERWQREAEDLLLTPEQRALRDAERAAEEKMRFVREDLWIVVVCGLLLFTPAMPLGVILTIFWGRPHIKRGYRLFLEPKLRDQFLRHEVQQQVAATLSQERQVLESEHARSMQELSASIAHEIRNPITAAKSLVQQMEEDPISRDNVEYARVALEELQRVERSVSHLLRFARDEDMGSADVRLAEVIDSAVETFRDRLERNSVTLERNLDTEGAMYGDPEKLRRVVINLVGNAIEALEDSGAPDAHVEIAMGENLAGSEVWLRVKDNGPGIEADVQSRLFSPFYTSKANGTGLGLAITRKVVEAHGGSIELSSAPGVGAEFLLVFPKRGTTQEEGR